MSRPAPRRCPSSDPERGSRDRRRLRGGLSRAGRQVGSARRAATGALSLALIVALALFIPSVTPEGALHVGPAAAAAAPPSPRARTTKRRKPRRRKPRRRKPRRRKPRRAEATPKAPTEAAPSAPAEPAPLRTPALQRSNRMELDARLVRGETPRSGAVYLFERAPRRLPPLVTLRQSYLDAIVTPLLGPGARDANATERAAPHAPTPDQGRR